MKSTLAILLLALLIPLRAQDAPGAGPGGREAEDYRYLSAKVEDLEETIRRYQQRFNTLTDEIRLLREEIAKVRDDSRNSNLDEVVRQHAKAIEEVDRKRIADREHVLNAISKLEKEVLAEFRSLANKAQAIRPPPPPAEPKSPPPGDEKGYEWTVRPGDTLSGIVAALNKEGIKVTQTQIKKANPKIKWESLGIGSKVFIPVPPKGQ